MYHLQYVTAKQLSPVKNVLIQIMNAAQDKVSKEFTFQFYFVGSVERNMVTYDPSTNIGFDFDVDLQINDSKRGLSAKEIKDKIRKAFDSIAPDFGYSYLEDSTRVLTMKFKDVQNSKIIHSCDFAIVRNYLDEDGIERQKSIRYHKQQNTYTWEKQPNAYYLLKQKEKWIKDSGHWNTVRDLYLNKKNANCMKDKRSESIYAEAVHETCQKYGYYSRQ